jgi:broad specificity phosphatase PhoE
MQASFLLRGHLKTPRLVTSPFSRSRATAEIVASILHSPITEEPDLREMDFGEATGCTPSQFEAMFPCHAKRIADVTDLDYAWPGGESRRSVLSRVKQVLRKWLNTDSTDEIVLISHWIPLGFMHAEIRNAVGRWDIFAPPRATPVSFLIFDKKVSGKAMFSYTDWSWKPK